MATRKPKLLDAQELMDYALRCLGGRAYSIGEIRSKLQRRAVESGSVEEVLGRLKQAGYLNDQRFADGYATARLENQGHGKMRVLRDLRQRRVAPAVAEKAVDGAFRETDEATLIEEFLRRKYRGKRLETLLAEEKHLAAAYRRLRYAGFSASNSIRVLKRFAAAAEALESLESLDEPEEEQR
jgi:regulatory protein